MKIIKKRIQSIFVIFILWFLIIIIYLFYFTVYSRSEYLKKSNSLSFREAKIPAPRGAIFDKNGTKLAWTLIYYDLYLKNKPITDNHKKYLLQQISTIFPGIKKIDKYHHDDEIIIIKKMTPQNLKSAQILLSSTPELSIRPTPKRISIKMPEVKKYIGTARYINDKWIGVSGIEKEFNSHLNGSDGLYTVMIDKDGKWIKGTGMNKKKMIPGKNLFLKESINDIVKNAEL